jgi:hypothetical protein
MNRTIPWLVSTLIAAGLASPALAQLPVAPRSSAVSIEDPNIKNAVIAVAIRYDKLGLASEARPGVNYLPSGVYANKSGVKFAVENGRITKLTRPGSPTVLVESIRLTEQGVLQLIGTPADRGLSAAGETLVLPLGTYVIVGGGSSLTITDGRPSRFILPGTTQGLHEVNDQPVPVVAPIRR